MRRPAKRLLHHPRLLPHHGPGCTHGHGIGHGGGASQVSRHFSQIQAEEIVTVLVDPRDGRLVVEIDDVAYRTLVDAPDVKKKFIQIMKKLSEVVTQPDDNPPVVAQPHPATPAPQGPPPLPDGSMPGDLPSYKLKDNVSAPKDTKKGAIPEIDLAGAIEAYLQHKLQYTPQYAHRQIHVRSAPGGNGVLIQVDTVFYEAVSDVADPEVRAFLTTAIQEWQQRQHH